MLSSCPFRPTNLQARAMSERARAPTAQRMVVEDSTQVRQSTPMMSRERVLPGAAADVLASFCLRVSIAGGACGDGDETSVQQATSDGRSGPLSLIQTREASTVSAVGGHVYRGRWRQPRLGGRLAQQWQLCQARRRDDALRGALGRVSCGTCSAEAHDHVASAARTAAVSQQAASLLLSMAVALSGGTD